MILGYWESHLGLEVATDRKAELQERLPSSRSRGVTGSELKEVLEEHGLRVFIFEGQWSDLTGHVRKGRPVIVCLDGGGSSIPLHYVVVVGFDEEAGLILVHDPSQRARLKFERRRFEELWSRSEFWTLLAVPADA